jgi:hypothetical protein
MRGGALRRWRRMLAMGLVISAVGAFRVGFRGDFMGRIAAGMSVCFG